jgi:uncharacterized protein (DUF885 family)
MNYLLDLLPVDVMKIINRKLHDAQIIKRKIERKENKRIAKENKRKADRRRMIFEKFAGLYIKHLHRLEEKTLAEESKINYEIVDKQYKYCDKLLQKAYDKYGKFIKQVEYFIGIGEKPHIIILASMFDIPFKEIFY